jgi:hypothetical protein
MQAVKEDDVIDYLIHLGRSELVQTKNYLKPDHRREDIYAAQHELWRVNEIQWAGGSSSRD